MGLLGFLLGKSKIEQRLDKQEEQVKDAFEKVKKDISKIAGRVGKLEKITSESELEKIVKKFVSDPVVEEKEQKNSIGSNSLLEPASKPGYSELLLSPAQKKVLSVLAQHPDMTMSYRDIGSVLRLNPTTVKNTINQIKKNIPEMLDESNADNGEKRYYLNKNLKFKTMIPSRPERDNPDFS